MSEFNEPWKEGERHESMCYLDDASGRAVVQLKPCKIMDYPLFQSQIDRVLAAVNFCRNLPTEWLEKHVATELCDDIHCELESLHFMDASE